MDLGGTGERGKLLEPLTDEEYLNFYQWLDEVDAEDNAQSKALADPSLPYQMTSVMYSPALMPRGGNMPLFGMPAAMGLHHSAPAVGRTSSLIPMQHMAAMAQQLGPGASSNPASLAMAAAAGGGPAGGAGGGGGGVLRNGNVGPGTQGVSTMQGGVTSPYMAITGGQMGPMGGGMGGMRLSGPQGPQIMPYYSATMHHQEIQQQQQQKQQATHSGTGAVALTQPVRESPSASSTSNGHARGHSTGKHKEAHVRDENSDEDEMPSSQTQQMQGRAPSSVEANDKRSRNKRAAEKYRKKKKEEQSAMTSAVVLLQQENEKLKERVKVLEQELFHARAMSGEAKLEGMNAEE